MPRRIATPWAPSPWAASRAKLVVRVLPQAVTLSRGGQVGVPDRGGHARGRLQGQVAGEHVDAVAGLEQPHRARQADHPGATTTTRSTITRSAAPVVLAREARRRALPGRLRRTAHRPPADGDPGADDQGRRLGAGPLRRRLLQAAELDVAARARCARDVDEDGRVEWTVTSEGRRHAADPDRGGRCTTPRTTSASTPGLQKDGVEKHLQELLAEHPATLADGLTLVRREYPTAIGPVDLMCRDAAGASVAVEIKRRGEIDGVEQLTRYLELLNRDPLLAPGPRHLRRPGDQAAGAGARRGPRHRLRGRRLRRPARLDDPTTGCSDCFRSTDAQSGSGPGRWCPGVAADTSMVPAWASTIAGAMVRPSPALHLLLDGAGCAEEQFGEGLGVLAADADPVWMASTIGALAVGAQRDPDRAPARG